MDVLVELLAGLAHLSWGGHPDICGRAYQSLHWNVRQNGSCSLKGVVAVVKYNEQSI